MTPRPVLLITLPSLGVGGTEQFLTSLASQLSDEFEVHFYIFSRNIALKERLRGTFVHVNSGPLRGIAGLRKLVHDIKPAVILSSILDLNLIIIFLRFVYPVKTKIIVREAADSEVVLKLSRYPKLTRFIYRRLYPRADCIICLSENMRQSVLNILAPDQPRVEVISNAVGAERFQKLLSSPLCNETILAVGRLTHQKGFDQLIKAFAEFKKTEQGRDYKLIIVGDGDQAQELQSSIFELGLMESVYLKGLVDDPSSLYIGASFLALPSRYEGVSNVMLESLVNGLPVLATSNRTSAEHYIDCSNGVLIDKCNETEIFSGLMQMSKKLANFDRKSIAHKWRQQLKLSVVAEQYADVIRSIST